MQLPKRCCLRIGETDCQIPPSFIAHIISQNGQYMIGVVCRDHKDAVEQYLLLNMHDNGDVVRGQIKFDPIKIISTDCVRKTKENSCEN
ncbi:MAG TPA: hypothetical protein VE622_01930 [Nitrososphaeraceae archaeon]|nr:hypothetical protein [Nitrososphaeraceae archaeon]